MRSSDVDVPTADGVADALLVTPDDDGPHPGVLFIMDAFGLRPRIADMMERIADRGYAVLAPNVFYRAGRTPVLPLPDFSDPDQRAGFMREVRPLMEQLTPERLATDGAAYLDRLARVASGPAAATGYCMGGRVAWRIAAAHPDRVVAVAGFHTGGLVTNAPDSPHRSAAELRGIELYFGHADNDRSMTPEQIADLERALDEAGATYRSELYEGAAHGYTMSDTSAWNEAACDRHFTELFGLLDRTLRAR